MNEDVIVRKSFALKSGEVEDNKICGAASVTGVLDRGRDVIFPGAWNKTLKGFLANGFVAVGHAWDKLPVAMPIVAKEQGNQLYTEATFHSTDDAQDARTICLERLAKGLSVGLSVGFMLSYGDEDHPPYQYFESGQKLLDYAKANGYDMSLFDTKGIKACKGYCRGILNIDELLEYSIVPVPCNQAATATEAKAMGAGAVSAATLLTERDFEAFLREAGYSRKDATAITSHGFKVLQRDAEGQTTEEQDTTEKENKKNAEQPPAGDGAGEAGSEASAETGSGPAGHADGLDNPVADDDTRTEELRALELRTLQLRTAALRQLVTA